MSSHDTIVIGAGLAGLRCAIRLAEAGSDVVLLEAEDTVGGRERTDLVDGFRLDRGFHVLNPAYPAVRRWVDIDALDLHRFPVAVGVRRDTDLVHLAHPLRHPTRILETLRSGMLQPRDVLALARWVAPTILSARAATHGPDRSLAEGWDRAGLRGPLRASVLEPFLAGVIADDRQQTSDAFVRLLVRSFALGRPGLPAAGIGALPAHLADRARRTGVGIRLSHRVVAVHRTGRTWRVEIDGADAVSARTIVFATGLDQSISTTTTADIPALPRTRGLQTWWFAADTPPTDDAALRVDGRTDASAHAAPSHRPGPIVNTAVITNTVPSYAPPGQHLIQATCVLGADAGPPESAVRRQLADIWSADTRPWRLLRRDDIPAALPAQDPPLRLRRPVRLGEGRYVAGDHRHSASIQGALVSGHRAAEAVLADLAR